MNKLIIIHGPAHPKNVTGEEYNEEFIEYIVEDQEQARSIFTTKYWELLNTSRTPLSAYVSYPDGTDVTLFSAREQLKYYVQAMELHHTASGPKVDIVRVSVFPPFYLQGMKHAAWSYVNAVKFEFAKHMKEAHATSRLKILHEEAYIKGVKYVIVYKHKYTK